MRYAAHVLGAATTTCPTASASTRPSCSTRPRPPAGRSAATALLAPGTTYPVASVGPIPAERPRLDGWPTRRPMCRCPSPPTPTTWRRSCLPGVAPGCPRAAGGRSPATRRWSPCPARPIPQLVNGELPPPHGPPDQTLLGGGTVVLAESLRTRRPCGDRGRPRSPICSSSSPSSPTSSTIPPSPLRPSSRAVLHIGASAPAPLRRGSGGPRPGRLHTYAASEIGLVSGLTPADTTRLTPSRSAGRADGSRRRVRFRAPDGTLVGRGEPGSSRSAQRLSTGYRNRPAEEEAAFLRRMGPDRRFRPTGQ